LLDYQDLFDNKLVIYI